MIKKTLAGLGLLAICALPARAQLSLLGKPIEEVRVDIQGISMSSWGTTVNAGIPGSLAIGLYLNDRIGIEPTLGLTVIAPDDANGRTEITGGFGFPYYVRGDRGHSGYFVSPSVEIRKVSNQSAVFSYGADLGYKAKLNDGLSVRMAMNLRDKDFTTSDGFVFRGIIGLSFFLKQ